MEKAPPKHISKMHNRACRVKQTGIQIKTHRLATMLVWGRGVSRPLPTKM